MTVLTKPGSGKKSDKLDVPLVQKEDVVNKNDVEVELPPHIITIRERAKRVSTATTICACITAILVLTTGVIGGIYLYRQLARAQMHRYKTFCDVQYKKQIDIDDASQKMAFHDYLNADPDSDSPEDNQDSVVFKEEFELDLDTDLYEEIEVPDFTGGRRGRFIHDFSANKTGIIDLDGRRCFVMELNRTLVLPPHSLLDLILKMRAGYYEVDTEVVRDTMYVVHPRITDFKSVGYYIARECSTLKTYMLERDTPVSRRDLGSFQKRSADEWSSTFTQFSGNKIWSLQIVDKKSPDFANRE